MRRLCDKQVALRVPRFSRSQVLAYNEDAQAFFGVGGLGGSSAGY